MAKLLEQSSIRAIANEIASGNTCYIHKASAKITIIDNSMEGEEKIAAQEKKQAAIEKEIKNYLKIENLTTKQQRVIMKDFLIEVKNKSVRKQLSNALNRKNPIRNFHQTIESDMELTQYWRNFNLTEYQTWISNFVIDAHNY